MPRLRPFFKILLPALIVLSLLGIYLHTLAPGLTWANEGNDGGDLITAAATGGVAHPTGYPLYLLLARLFQWLPVGSLAYRTNLLSAVSMALAAAFVYVLAASSSSDSEPGLDDRLAGAAAAAAFGLAPLVWSQAVITEVYGLQALLTGLILYLYAVPLSAGEKRLDSLRGLTLGLAMGNHVTTALLLPAALLLGSVHHTSGADSLKSRRGPWYTGFRLDSGALLRQAGMFCVGLSIYLILPLRALGNPPVNWGNVITPGRLWWLVSGKLYQSYYLQFSLAGLWERVQAWAGLLLDQFGLAGLVLGLIGLVVFGRLSPLYLLTAWTACVSTIFAVLYRAPDSNLYLLPMLLSLAIWIGLGTGGLVRLLGQHPAWLRAGLSLLVMTYFIGRSASWVNQVDASQDLRAESFGGEVLSAIPQGAILFAKGDRAVFALWYFHFALGERPDLSVVAADLLHFDWYQENLRATYPSLEVPGPFPWPETLALANPGRAVCSARYSERAEIECSPSLAPP